MDGACDWDSDRPHGRNHIITTIDPPSSVELCEEHYAPGLIPLLADQLGIEPGPFYAYIEKYLKREAAKADRALADAQAAEAAEGSEATGAATPAGDAATAREVFSNDGVTVRNPSTPDEGDIPEPNMYAADNPAYADKGGDT